MKYYHISRNCFYKSILNKNKYEVRIADELRVKIEIDLSFIFMGTLLLPYMSLLLYCTKKIETRTPKYTYTLFPIICVPSVQLFQNSEVVTFIYETFRCSKPFQTGKILGKY